MLPQSFILTKISQTTQLKPLLSLCACGNKEEPEQKYGDVEVMVVGVPINISQIVHARCKTCGTITVFPESASRFIHAGTDFLLRHHPGTGFFKNPTSSNVNIIQREGSDMVAGPKPVELTDDPNKFLEGGRIFNIVKETNRRYIYPDGKYLLFNNVTSIHVSDSGNHYLNYSDELKAIVSPGWRAIEISGANEWTF